MFEPIKQKPRKILLGYPKCVCGDPFKLVNNPAEERAWIAANGPIKIEKSGAEAPVKAELGVAKKVAAKL